MSHLDRRNFIKNSVLAAAVAGLSARTYAQSAGANGDLRVAVVGFRSRGMEHIKELKKLKGVRIVALCDVDSKIVAKGLKDIPDAKGYTDMRKMLEDKDIDAVSIASPNHQHSIQGIWSLQAGKHLYVEKPLSHNIFEGQQLVAAANHFSKLIVQAGTQSRSGVGIRAAVKDVHAGKYGKVKLARAICYKRRKSIGPAKKNAIPSEHRLRSLARPGRPPGIHPRQPDRQERRTHRRRPRPLRLALVLELRRWRPLQPGHP